MFELTPFMRNAMTYDPFKDFDKPFKDFDEMEKRLFDSPRAFRTDIKDMGDSYLVEAELPGFTKEDVDISLEDDVMTVKASHNTEKEERNEGYLRRERRFGSFERSFDVSQIDTENISGVLENGILSLTLPKMKKPEKEARKIELR